MQVLIELDEDILRRLERVAPGKARKRSAFIRAAIQKSLWELEEEKTRRAYLAQPDIEPVALDPTEWEPLPYGGFEPPAPDRASGGRGARPRKAKKTTTRQAKA